MTEVDPIQMQHVVTSVAETVILGMLYFDLFIILIKNETNLSQFRRKMASCLRWCTVDVFLQPQSTDFTQYNSYGDMCGGGRGERCYMEK